MSLTGSMPVEGRLKKIPITGRLDGQRLRLQLLGNTEAVLDRRDKPEDANRVERIGGLIRAWGAIEFFHPYVAHMPVDWDAALLAAIPMVESARSAAEYADAVESMLKRLNDPVTRVITGDGLAMEPAEYMRQTQPQGVVRRLVRCGFPPSVRDFPGIGYYEDWETTESSPPYVVRLPEGVRVVMRTAEPAIDDPTILRNYKTYGDGLPTREQRLLALARYWNAIHFFYGYLDGIPSWDEALNDAIREFESAGTRHDYLFAIGHLASKTQDSHSSVIPELKSELGSFADAAVSLSQRQSVIRFVGNDEKIVAPGDVILTIDGVSVEQRRQSLLEVIPHSTSQAGLRVANDYLLAGHEAQVRVRVRKPDGEEVEAAIPRTAALPPAGTRPVVDLLPGGFGYFDLNQLKDSDLGSAFEKIRGSAALILDMRGYPPGFGVASRFIDRKVAGAEVTYRIWHGPDPALSTVRREPQFVFPSGKPAYKGHVVVLINAEASSLPEHLCLFLEAAAHPTFIGSPTSGTDGDVTNILLPGNIQAGFSAKAVRHADGRPLQRVGILPDIQVEPTIKGIHDGTDEVLQRAIEFLRSYH